MSLNALSSTPWSMIRAILVQFSEAADEIHEGFSCLVHLSLGNSGNTKHYSGGTDLFYILRRS